MVQIYIINCDGNSLAKYRWFHLCFKKLCEFYSKALKISFIHLQILVKTNFHMTCLETEVKGNSEITCCSRLRAVPPFPFCDRVPSTEA